MSKEKKSVWETLSAIDVKDKTKKKGSLGQMLMDGASKAAAAYAGGG